MSFRGPMRVQLETCFDNPYWIGHSSRSDTSKSSSREMNQGVLFAMVEAVGNDLLAVSVGEEVDRPSWHNAN